MRTLTCRSRREFSGGLRAQRADPRKRVWGRTPHGGGGLEVPRGGALARRAMSGSTTLVAARSEDSAARRLVSVQGDAA